MLLERGISLPGLGFLCLVTQEDHVLGLVLALVVASFSLGLPPHR